MSSAAALTRPQQALPGAHPWAPERANRGESSHVQSIDLYRSRLRARHGGCRCACLRRR